MESRKRLLLQTGSVWVAVILVGFFVIMSAVGCSRAPESDVAGEGATIYTQYCEACHGATGDGAGPAAYLLFPKPRNFQRGEFKLRSTRQGRPPTDADLVRTVSQGISGSSMFAFDELLNEAQIQAAVQYVRTFTPERHRAAPATDDDILDISTPPPPTPELVAAGAAVYEEFGCAQCHGQTGRGDGPSAPTLRDSEGDPFPAADFTHGIYKGGGRPEQLYRTFLTGMAGTPMPSYADAIQSEEQAWALVYYTLSLISDGQAKPIAGDPGPLFAADLANVLLEDPESAYWSLVPEHRVYMRPLWFRREYSLFTDVRAAVVGQQLYLRLEWTDGTHDATALQTDHFSDAVAVQLALADPPPFIGMGQRDDHGAVEIWYWRADRQAAAAGEAADLAASYRDVVVDMYPSSTNPTADAYLQRQQAPFVTGRDVGNPVSAPELNVEPVHSLAAAGYGTLTAGTDLSGRVSGRGARNEHGYAVVFSASLQPTDAALQADLTRSGVSIAVAIWDGAAGDRDGTKLVSQWLSLEHSGTELLADEEAQRNSDSRRNRRQDQ